MALKYLILGLINHQPLTGYDIDKHYRTVFNNFWEVKQRQIYNMLGRLHDQGLLDVEVIVQDGAPTKKVHHITEAGREALLMWLKKPLPRQPSRLDWLGQIHLSHNIDHADTIARLAAHRERCQRNLTVLREIVKVFQQFIESDHPTHKTLVPNLLTVHWGVRNNRFMIEWLTQAIDYYAAMQRGERTNIEVGQDLLNEIVAGYDD